MQSLSLFYFIKLYILTVPVFFLIDFIWLALIARGLYLKNIGFLLSSKPNWTVAIIFYLVYIFGILIFAVIPAVKDESVLKALMLGALFGLIAYATYDLTNLATVKNWPISISLIDITWGTILTATVAVISYCIGHFLK